MFDEMDLKLARVKKAPNKYIIGMTGAGSVGKTSLAEIILKEIPGSKFVGSTSRSTFKRLGIENEAEQRTMNATQKWELQQEIQLDYVRNFCASVEQLNDDPLVNILVFDRMLTDHRAYCIFQCNEVLTDGDYKLLDHLIAKQLKHFDSLLYCPYPPAFEVKSDGFRDMDRFKDTVVDALIYSRISKFSPQTVIDGPPLSRFYAVYNYLRLTCKLSPSADLVARMHAHRMDSNVYRLMAD